MPEIEIIESPIGMDVVVRHAKATYGEMSKAVVDIARGFMAVGPEMHADAEELLIERGSRQVDLWGINLYPDRAGADFVEFDSMINIRPSQGNRSRSVEDPIIREKIRALVSHLVK